MTPHLKRALTLLTLALIAIFVYFNMGYIFSPANTFTVRVTPNHPSPIRSVAYQLRGNKIIKSKHYLLLLARLTGYDKKLQIGYYTIDNKMSPFAILKKMVDGDSDKISILIKEGDDIFEIGKRLVELEVVANDEEFHSIVKDPKLLKLTSIRFGVPELHSLEGFLYPETYVIKKGSPPFLFLDAALSQFEKKMLPLYTSYAAQNSKTSPSLLWFLKAASLIEKETSLEAERRLIAGVLHNRITRGEKLRYDPSIIYAMKINGIYDENLVNGQIQIKKSHILMASPYNTYYIKGLPKTPISNPSAKSFQAALYPEKTPYFFFVAKGGNLPGHFFAETYEEHEQNIAIYRRNNSK